ncbi:DUF1236 domain-containing protein [Pseudohoeflea coraliihabitans]|uniref:DUF1236 domain-containing protein n=1 Tax=Pseudohoeflea coraliihabitans TaxID=2860393 RepID=A0ABS6WNH7_9HYPH|nr:DUF1236 domain-containing protein [Pseudohoeflea sp. DP4N28-3]MBW3097524.1 DUF1236 domain-containing protein [Pseudohoeflea sp. DP4N28-3]
MKKFLALTTTAALLASASLTAPAFAASEGTAAAGASGIIKKDDNGVKARGNVSGDVKASSDAADLDATGKVKTSSEMSASSEAPGQVKKTAEGVEATDRAPGQLKKNDVVDAAKDVAPGQMKPSKETTASVRVDAEKEDRLRTVFAEAETDPVDVDFEVTIGATVPDTVVLNPLPATAIEVVPVYSNYRYFVTATGETVIVAPSTNEIVYVIS